MGFKLIRLDSEEPTKIPLKVGTHIIGRGSFINCDDQRVSRRHGVLEVTESAVLLKSLHQNPCFYNKPELKKTELLPQGKSIPLSNTDHFGLLPDTYWYEIIFCADNNQSNIPVQIEKDKSLDTETQNMNGETDLNEETRVLTGYDNSGIQEVRYQAVGDDGSDSEFLNLEFDETMKDDGDESQSLISDNPKPGDSTNTPKDPITSQIVDQFKGDETYCEVTPSKRSHTPDQSHGSKKVKTEPKSPEGYKNQEIKSAESHSISDIAGSTSPIYEDTNSQNTRNITIQQNAIECSNSTDMEEQAKDSNTDAESNVDTDPSRPSNEVKKEQETPTTTVKAEPQSPKKEKKDPDVPKPGPSHDQAGSSSDGGAAPKPPYQPIRERCIYGASCYRKNPQHKAQFCHPADADHGPGARGACPYGAACRRRDPRHWALHDHPPGARAPGPGAGGQPGNRPKRPRRVVRTPSESEDSDQDSPSPNLIVHGKRKRKPVNRETWSDSGEETQDPYATDESDEWEPSSDVTHTSHSQGF